MKSLVAAIKNGNDFTLGYFLLPNGLQVMVTLKKKGQQQIHYGDNVVVEGRLYLPKDEKLNYLHPEITFGNRLNCMGSPLVHDWGWLEVTADRFRYVGVEGIAEKWVEAADIAIGVIHKSYSNLCEAITRRMTALEEA